MEFSDYTLAIIAILLAICFFIYGLLSAVLTSPNHEPNYKAIERKGLAFMFFAILGGSWAFFSIINRDWLFI